MQSIAKKMSQIAIAWCINFSVFILTVLLDLLLAFVYWQLANSILLKELFFIWFSIWYVSQIPDLKEIILIGFYQSSENLSKFITNAQQEFNIPIRYYTINSYTLESHYYININIATFLRIWLLICYWLEILSIVKIIKADGIIDLHVNDYFTPYL